MDEDKHVVLSVNMRSKKGYTNTLVGQCVEVPFIIVEGQNVQELTKKLLYEFEVYFNTFPEEGKKILEKYGKILQTDEKQKSGDSKEGWTEKKIEVPIPISH